MIRRLTISLLISASSVCGFSKTDTAMRLLHSSVTETYYGKADSLTHCFIEKFMNKSKGIFNERPGVWGQYIYWQQAHAIDVIIYAYERHKDDGSKLKTTYSGYIRRWYANKGNNYSSGATGFENPYTDDMCWICLTLMHMGDALGTRAYHTVAKKLFDNGIMSRAKEDDTGLWLPWNTDEGSGPNACTLSPACLIAAKMYEKYGDEKYLEYAEKFYDYMTKHITKSDWRVEEPPLTYTQGTFAEACRMLYHLTQKNTAYKNRYKQAAFQYVNYAFTSGRCTNGSNILRHEGTSMDQSIFKAVLIPYAVNFVMDSDMLAAQRVTIAKLVQKNAKTMWNTLDLERYPTVFCNYDWTKTYDGVDSDASMGAMASGASLLENTARMCKFIEEGYEDYMTAIDAPEADGATAVGCGVYRIDGTRILAPWQSADNLAPGLYIINGKKTLVK